MTHEPRPQNPPAHDPRRSHPIEALKSREVPPGVLDGLCAAVQARLASVPPGGALSLAFLDTPKALRRWRTAALAASLVVAGGVGLLASGKLRVEEGSPREVPLIDARGVLLEDMEAPDVGPIAPRGNGVRVGTRWPAHQAGAAFFAPRVMPVADVKTEERWN
jgi:hypothetical protein